MRRCLSCLERFDDRRRVCPADGDILISEGRAGSETGRVLEGRYKLGMLIGEGGMGQVYEASRLASGELVAVKLIRQRVVDESTIARFQREAAALSALKHPGVVRLLDFQRLPGGGSFMVMERLKGPTFTELRRAGKFASIERAVELVAQASRVVAAAHEQGIVHRDLKPSNLVLHREGDERFRVKVLDFGVAKFLDGGDVTLTLSGEMVGTIPYMAPEQTAGKPVSPASDVYSFGTILFEILSGRLPFEGRSVSEWIWMKAAVPAPSVSRFRPDVPEMLDEIVARCLAKLPENRFPDAGALARALEDPRASGAIQERPATPDALYPNPSLWVGSIIDERYELHEWIGLGRYRSHVYRATHLRTGANLAVRVWRTGKPAVRDCLVEAFRSEARTMDVRHPNLISVLDLGFTDDCVFLVTEFVESESLRDLINRSRPLPRDRAVRLIRGAAGALAAMHGKHLLAGGLSPETIRVTGAAGDPRELLLSPLGLTSLRQAELLLDPEGGGEAERMLSDYLAPEQRSGSGAGPSSDLYSLGVILLEMLGGSVHAAPPDPAPPKPRPDDGPTPVHAEEDLRLAMGPRAPAGLDETWGEFFRRALAASPGDRFAHAEAFLASLPPA